MKRVWAALLVFVGLACGEETWKATGVVDQLLVPDQQVIVAHDDIPGLMPAMTMNFYAEPALLAKLEVGHHRAIELPGQQRRDDRRARRATSRGRRRRR